MELPQSSRGRHDRGSPGLAPGFRGVPSRRDQEHDDRGIAEPATDILHYRMGSPAESPGGEEPQARFRAQRCGREGRRVREAADPPWSQAFQACPELTHGAPRIHRDDLDADREFCFPSGFFPYHAAEESPKAPRVTFSSQRIGAAVDDVRDVMGSGTDHA